MDSEAMENKLRLDIPRPADQLAGWRGGKPVSRAELFAGIDAWRAQLGNQKGRNFALFAADSIDFASMLFGALQAGKRVFLPADALPATCASLSREVDGYLGEFHEDWQPLSLSSAFKTLHSGPCEALELALPEHSELVIYTSGSTGEAQAIPKRMSQLLTEVDTLERHFGHLCQDADVLATVSHQHIYGLLFKVLWPLSAGRPIHTHSISFPEELVAATSDRAAVLVSSPAHLKRFPDSTVWDNATPQLRMVFSSGGPLNEQAARETSRLLGVNPIEIYGSSESGGIAWRTRGLEESEGWRPMLNVEWRMCATDGVLEIRSPHLPNTNWFRMADRVVPLGEGRFLLQGRTDRIVKVEEKRISLDAIERQLIESPLVNDARVMLVDTGKDSQRIAAFVVLTKEGKRALDAVGKLALNRRLRDSLMPYFERVALPKIWRYPSRLPVNAQGKTTHAELMALLSADKPGALTAPITPTMRLLQRNEQTVTIELVIPKNLLYLEGHFPGSPILPGVVQLDWAISLGKRYFNLPPVFQGIQALKFQRVIKPEIPVILELKHDADRSILAFRYLSSESQHASGRVQFGGAHV